ncbi:hypothetical protein CHL78_012255 [Romboutsia weinsteinii]|uniref:Uncharacterized protein n=1 Tax=Romboutsia weinsteinii TaxID=2020949 RepID=A0A371J227_9FIRM|nr:hypothetical protein [Romboutsia weinsteinii]RDY26718.1 hypothetical protein CHL78_012255 [Romboutsia weinsteinii]
MKSDIKKLQRGIWIDIAVFMVLYIPCGMLLEYLDPPVLSIRFWAIILLPPIFLIISIYNKLKQIPYTCRNCKALIHIKFRHMFSLHAGNQRRMKCPYCQKVTWAEIKENE